MSQVRNLRAMFEQRGESSPPDRGREQGLPAQPADSPRPLSRVRTSFVTVEKDGRVGLQRDTSTDSIPTLSRTVSGGTEGETAPPPASKADIMGTKDTAEVTGKLEGAKLAPVVAQTPKRIPAPIPEETTPVTPKKVETPAVFAKPTAAATPKVPATAEVKISASTPMRSNEGQSDSAGTKPTNTKAAAGNGTALALSPRKLFAKPSSNAESHPSPRVTAPSSNSVANGIAKGVSDNVVNPPRSRAPAPNSNIPLRPKVASASGAAKEAQKTTTAASSGKTAPKAISTTKANAKPSVKSPGLAVKTPTSPAKPLTPKFHTKTPDKKTPSATPKSVASSSTAGKSTAPSSTKKPAAIQTFPPNGIGFVKPKPKSPTRPVQLPSSLTTHTASSATKVNIPRQSLSRQSGNFLVTHQPVVRSPSRASVSTVGTTATTGPRSLRRQSSTIGRPRPSIGPPPKQPARDHPVTKKEKEVDEGFLARMMRPTQASASKTADKVQLSPPRKQPVPATRQGAVRDSIGPPLKRQSETAPVKAAAPKPSAAATEPVSSTAEVTAQIISPITEKLSTAEEIVAVANEAEGPVVLGSGTEPLEQASTEPVEVESVLTVVETSTEEEEKNEPNQAAAEPTTRESAATVNGVNGVHGVDGVNDQESDVPAIDAADAKKTNVVTDNGIPAVEVGVNGDAVPEEDKENSELQN